MHSALIEKKKHRFLVTEDDIAAFDSGTVHRVCSTFALAREIEWCTRLYVLDIKQEDEEGIGSLLEIRHIAPAMIGEYVDIEAQVEEFDNNRLFCTYSALVDKRLVAKGRTGQRLLLKSQIAERFEQIVNGR